MHETKPINLHLLGYAYGKAGMDARASEGPSVMQQSAFLPELKKNQLTYQWDKIIELGDESSPILENVRDHCQILANNLLTITQAHQPFIVIGGDHTSAIGTWSGVAEAIAAKGPLGLVWIDAHMDSHTPETTVSKRLHGMPLACLLGFGDPQLTSILSPHPKIKPEHLCLIGVRSFEKGEAELLKELNVHVFYMDEIITRGIESVLLEAKAIVSQGTAAYGLSIDLDGIDPRDAPAVNAAEPNGIRAEALCSALPVLTADKKFLGLEIAEFDPHLDHDRVTEKLIVKLIESCFDANA